MSCFSLGLVGLGPVQVLLRDSSQRVRVRHYYIVLMKLEGLAGFLVWIDNI